MLLKLIYCLIDNPINQNIIKTFLKKLKIRYETANNGQEAVDKWRNGNFHIVLVRMGNIQNFLSEQNYFSPIVVLNLIIDSS